MTLFAYMNNQSMMKFCSFLVRLGLVSLEGEFEQYEYDFAELSLTQSFVQVCSI